MDGPSSRVAAVILIALILFGIGRLFQRTVDTWAGWGKAIQAAAEAAAKVLPAKTAARKAVRRMISYGLGAAVLFAALLNAIIRS
ncbi:hypothetical protein [Streptosporangium sp. NPDC051022]|uniref:hypothetical protein n=1 Tax=Streptosporangium sp. NPDC051022 TaxID=3155752 RepID=UPI0034409F4D